MFPTTAVGTYHWTATYNGDANNTAVSSTCTAEPVVITQAVPTVATAASAGGVIGTSISDTATVSGGHSPTGNVTFHLFSPTSPNCTGDAVFTSTNALNGATPPSATSGMFPTTAVGTYHWTATYNGDTNNTAVTSACAAEPVVITQAIPTIATVASTGGPVGTSIGDTATVSGGFAPTGTVTFRLFAPTSPTCTGDPVFTSPNDPLDGGRATSGAFATTTVGTYHWTATYNGDTNNTAVTSACAAEPVVITQATPTIATVASTGGPVGTSISDTATVSGGFTPTGTVTFDLFAPTSPDCTGDPFSTSTNTLTAGSATSDSFATTAVGTYHWVAVYNGDINNAAVTSACTAEPVVITQATPTIRPRPRQAGRSARPSRHATVSGGFNPTGDVTFNLYLPGNTTCTGPRRSPPPTRQRRHPPAHLARSHHRVGTYTGRPPTTVTPTTWRSPPPAPPSR